jgi:hypothetical protein
MISSQFMKILRSNFATILLLIATNLVIGCAQTVPKVGPTPSTVPVSTSNAATRAAIKRTQTSIYKTREDLKQSRIHAAKGATSLEKADDLLSQMLKK